MAATVKMGYLDREALRTLLLNANNQVMGNICQYCGTVTCSLLRVAENNEP
ncbi:MAG: hypothetical protein JO011_09310 [Ktedonobacteraceae bacterium]|nr:hypothetical protein [Ktedonobacteraceae bacterium]MBV9711098.1 hypothetical protein [Ktedonobacteraceae bacterium]